MAVKRTRNRFPALPSSESHAFWFGVSKTDGSLLIMHTVKLTMDATQSSSNLSLFKHMNTLEGARSLPAGVFGVALEVLALSTALLLLEDAAPI